MKGKHLKRQKKNSLKTKRSKRILKITADMTIAEIIRKKPEVIQKLMFMGMGCVGCHMSAFETLRQGAEAHGIDIDEILAELNKD